jgi:PPM family protein phosphatase
MKNQVWNHAPHSLSTHSGNSADPQRCPQKGSPAMTITFPDPAPSTRPDRPDPPMPGRREAAGTGVTGGVTLAWGAASCRGAARDVNQDDFLALPPVFAVADGMGGHAAGDQASACVVAALRAAAAKPWTTTATLKSVLREARTAIGGIRFDHGARPGSTLSGAIVTRDHRGRPHWMVVNIGDSRTHRWDGHRLQQLTEDHTVASELVSCGALNPLTARSSPYGAMLTRAVFADVEHQVDVWMVPIATRDRLLVCSDGLTGQLKGDMIARVLGTVADPGLAAATLVECVVAGGGHDDATAVVVDARVPCQDAG